MSRISFPFAMPRLGWQPRLGLTRFGLARRGPAKSHHAPVGRQPGSRAGKWTGRQAGERAGRQACRQALPPFPASPSLPPLLPVPLPVISILSSLAPLLDGCSKVTPKNNPKWHDLHLKEA